MQMPVMHVGNMRVAVQLRLMGMDVAVGLAAVPSSRVLVLVMRVM
jgi:hypothetical protein